jgi:hypothetical protein
MLGDQIAEVKGRLTGQRVLDVEGPKIEYSFSANGRMKEVDITHIATFYTIPKGNNGVLYGKGEGVITTKDDSGEMTTEIGRGIGQFAIDSHSLLSFNFYYYYLTVSDYFIVSVQLSRPTNVTVVDDALSWYWSKHIQNLAQS